MAFVISCPFCDGTGQINGIPCEDCYGDGEISTLIEFIAATTKYCNETRLADLEGKIDDIMDKCNDIFEKLNE